jgi:hypothetical protein
MFTMRAHVATVADGASSVSNAGCPAMLGLGICFGIFVSSH